MDQRSRFEKLTIILHRLFFMIMVYGIFNEILLQIPSNDFSTGIAEASVLS